MKLSIKKAVVLGSGAMGAQIACHFANGGVDVLLLDIPPKELTDEEREKGKKLDDPEVKNRIVNSNLKKTISMSPSPLYLKEYSQRIATGNFDDDMEKVADADWIVEAIVEKEDIKKALYEKAGKYRKEGTIISSNTSGIPINKLIEGRSEDFQKHFLGTHFFNPPRYLELLELIPSKETDREVVESLQEFGDVFLGKTTIICKDTPAFIGNRIGVYAIMLSIKLMEDIGLTIEEVDTLTGKFVGRPKTATFRTADLVGLDILADVSQGVYDNCPHDEERGIFKIPGFIKQMLDNGWLGQKAGQGFYKKTKDDEGNSKILALDIEEMEYKPSEKPKFTVIEEVKQHGSTEEKLESFEQGDTSTVNFFKKMYLKAFGNDDDKAIQFFREFYYRLFAYCSQRIPEISGGTYKIDKAIKAGFNWEYGPFEIWDILGFEDTYQHMQKAGHLPADWVHSMKTKGFSSFYKIEDGHRLYYDQQAGTYKPEPGTDELISLNNYRDHTVFSNEECNIIDLKDGVINVEFTSKSNAIGMGVMEGIHKAIDLAESGATSYKAVVIANEGKDFSVGANLGMIGMSAFKGNMGTVKQAVEQFQKVNQRICYSSIPVVAAIHGKTLGGGAEIAMYSDTVQAAAETYIGLVEVGAGLIPGGGGTTAFAKRASGEYDKNDPKTHHLQQRLLVVSQAKTATSAYEGFELGYLVKGRDQVTMNKNRLIYDAKQRALSLVHAGYHAPARQKVEVLGRNALSYFYTAISNMKFGHYITDYDEEIVRKLAFVMCGGDVTGVQQVDEKYLLKLERDAFLDLVKNKKTLKRIEHLLKQGKPLRN